MAEVTGGSPDSHQKQPPAPVGAQDPLPDNCEYLSEYFMQKDELAKRARNDFLASMNHDLRTPLNAVIGFAQIIESEMHGKVNPQYLEYAKHIQESGLELLAKIEDLLDDPYSEAQTDAVSDQRVTRKAKKLAVAD
jgi:signal transduction histidine kinase